jgi:hypothetical protein
MCNKAVKIILLFLNLIESYKLVGYTLRKFVRNVYISLTIES